jgi:outer membrane lipoprotein carrier protein
MLRAVLLLVALAAFAPPARAGGDDAVAPVLKRLQQRYETTRTLIADFKQTVESPTLAGALESKGTVAFEKPNRMRWDYAPPDKQIIVGDGDTLWIYQPDERQVIKAKLGAAFQARTPITFLAGLGRIERDFAASLEREDAERWVLKLVPRDDTGIGTLTLTLKKPDAVIEEARITDPLGTTTRLALSAEKRNVTIDAAQFRFTPPPGVDVVSPPAY